LKQGSHSNLDLILEKLKLHLREYLELLTQLVEMILNRMKLETRDLMRTLWARLNSKMFGLDTLQGRMIGY
jgi:hypothetical protein